MSKIAPLCTLLGRRSEFLIPYEGHACAYFAASSRRVALRACSGCFILIIFEIRAAQEGERRHITCCLKKKVAAFVDLSRGILEMWRVF